MVEANPLNNLIHTVQLTDSEVRRVMRDAANEADRVIRSMGDSLSASQELRAMQLDLARINARAWGSVGQAATVGIGDAFDATADWQSAYDQSLMASLGARQSYWRQSMLAASRQGLPNYLARKENGYTLSDRVYRNTALSKGYVDRAVNNALILGKTPRELASDVRKYIDPATPGGASYAALRLGRTEVVNAYHTTAKNRYEETPWVERVRWSLSGSHGKPDVCNEYADSTHVRGGGPGEFKSSEVPGKPHPQCLCYIMPVVPSLDKFAKDFHSGKYDDYINNLMGCTRVA